MEFLFLLVFLSVSTSVSSSEWNCGKNFRASRGIISTPNFPRRFNTPIKCRWTIDSLDYDNSSIKVYLTQLYVYEGLRFIEYGSQYLYERYKREGVVIFEVNEDNFSNMRYVQSNNNFLVIEFQLERTDGANLRVVEGLLDVFGFNITYEITNGPPRQNGCTMKQCGFTGYCYDDFTNFKCDCFPGFNGPRCSAGEKSRCFIDGEPYCKNGAECVHVGHSARVCECKPGFAGVNCEIPVQKPKSGCKNCLVSCPFNGTLQNVCQCGKAYVDPKKDPHIKDWIGYSSRVFVNSPMKNFQLNQALRQTILEQLKANVSSRIETVNILSLDSRDGTNDLIRFYGPKGQERRVKALMGRWGHQRSIGNFTLLEKDFVVKTDPYLYLETVAIDKVTNISETEEFVLSCTARGSRLMVFRWFKDGMLVNITGATRNKGENFIQMGKSDHYTALLTIESANKLDEGTFTCHVEDYGIQQCRSLHVSVQHLPKIQLIPFSLTVEKGKPFRIQCITISLTGDKYKFSWSKDNTLLPMRTEHEHYEIIYPSGSILQVAGLNKTTKYSCIAHEGKLSAESSIRVYVIDKKVVRPCAEEILEGFRWPETAPGGENEQACPDGYFGFSWRSCIMLENGDPKWLPPDYSNCTSTQLRKHLNNFRYLMDGYAKTTPLATLKSIKAYVLKKTLIRGEGQPILNWMYKIMRFNNESGGYSSFMDTTYLVLDILDLLLNQSASFNKEQQIVSLQKLVHNQLIILADKQGDDFSINLNNLDVYLSRIDEYFMPSYEIRISYKNIYEFLTKKSVIRFNDDRELNYEMAGGVIALWNIGSGGGVKAVSANFSHAPAVGDSVPKCALAEFAASEYVWDTNKCSEVIVNATTTLCNCSTGGTMALLLVSGNSLASLKALDAPDKNVLMGCIVAVVCSALGCFILIFTWIKCSSSILFLRAQCAFCIMLCMSFFTLGFSNVFTQELYLYVMSSLVVCYLTAMSSQLCIVLIIYAELMEIRNFETIQQPIIGAMTGAPLIAALANHLAHSIKNIRLEHWWLLSGTLSFYVFIICSLTIFILFVVLCCLAWKFIKSRRVLASDTGASSSAAKAKRLSVLLKKSTVMLCSLSVSAGISITSVNFPDEITWQYAFAATSGFTGVVVLLCLVFDVQFLAKQFFVDKLRKGSNAESERKNGDQQNTTKSMEAKTTEVLSADHKQVANQSPIRDKSTQFNSAVCKSTSLNSPDILGSKVFAELDLVASSMQSTTSLNSLKETQGSTHTAVETGASTAPQQQQPVKKTDKCVTFCDVVNYESKDNGERLEDVMDSISNDLKYLLNGHIE